MTLAILGSAFAWLAVLAGLLLAVGHALRRRPATWQLWIHPVAATVALVCLWSAVALWQGPDDMMLNAGVFVVTLAFVAGAFMFLLRVSGLKHLPIVAIILHGATALLGCALLIAGLMRVSGGAG